MTVGKLIALLAEYCADVDSLLMCRSIYGIDVNSDNTITVYTVDGNSNDITISAKEEA